MQGQEHTLHKWHKKFQAKLFSFVIENSLHCKHVKYFKYSANTFDNQNEITTE